MRASVQVKDLGLNNIISEMKKLGSKEIDVGFFGSGKSADGNLPMSHLAGMQEGIPEARVQNIPARPFMDDTAIIYQDEIVHVMELGVGQLLNGSLKHKEVLDKVGVVYSDMTKITIEDFSSPANRQATVDKKGFNNPLIETGKMKNAVKHRVGKKQ